MHGICSLAKDGPEMDHFKLGGFDVVVDGEDVEAGVLGVAVLVCLIDRRF